MHKEAALPDRCVKSNQPAEGRRLKRKLEWCRLSDLPHASSAPPLPHLSRLPDRVPDLPQEGDDLRRSQRGVVPQAATEDRAELVPGPRRRGAGRSVGLLGRSLPSGRSGRLVCRNRGHPGRRVLMARYPPASWPPSGSPPTTSGSRVSIRSFWRCCPTGRMNRSRPPASGEPARRRTHQPSPRGRGGKKGRGCRLGHALRREALPAGSPAASRPLASPDVGGSLVARIASAASAAAMSEFEDESAESSSEAANSAVKSIEPCRPTVEMPCWARPRGWRTRSCRCRPWCRPCSCWCASTSTPVPVLVRLPLPLIAPA